MARHAYEAVVERAVEVWGEDADVWVGPLPLLNPLVEDWRGRSGWDLWNFYLPVPYAEARNGALLRTGGADSRAMLFDGEGDVLVTVDAMGWNQLRGLGEQIDLFAWGDVIEVQFGPIHLVEDAFSLVQREYLTYQALWDEVLEHLADYPSLRFQGEELAEKLDELKSERGAKTTDGTMRYLHPDREWSGWQKEEIR